MREGRVGEGREGGGKGHESGLWFVFGLRCLAWGVLTCFLDAACNQNPHDDIDDDGHRGDEGGGAESDGTPEGEAK